MKPTCSWSSDPVPHDPPAPLLVVHCAVSHILPEACNISRGRRDYDQMRDTNLRLSSVSTSAVFLAASCPSRCCLRSDSTTAILSSENNRNNDLLKHIYTKFGPQSTTFTRFQVYLGSAMFGGQHEKAGSPLLLQPPAARPGPGGADTNVVLTPGTGK